MKPKKTSTKVKVPAPEKVNVPEGGPVHETQLKFDEQDDTEDAFDFDGDDDEIDFNDDDDTEEN